MPNKRRQFLQSPLQLSLFDLEPTLLPFFSSGRIAPALPDNPAKPPLQRRVLAGPHVIEYRLRRSKRRSIGFLIEEEGLRITAPRWVTIAEIEAAVCEKQRWIIKKLDDQRKLLAQRKPLEPLRDGVTINFLGAPVTVRVRHDATVATVTLDAPTGTVMVSLRPNPREDALKTAMERWLQQEARRVFSERLPHFAQKIGVTYRSFALSSATTQWGSCTGGGALRLNWRLIHLPMHLLDYVVVHELSHLREMNHSARFWDTVQSAFPEYQAAEHALKQYSPRALSQP